MSGCTHTFVPVSLCLCVSAWEGMLLPVCVDTSTSMTEGCVHMSRVGRPCVGVSVGPCQLIRQGMGRVDTRVSEGMPVCTCVWTQGMGVMGGEADGPSWSVTAMAMAGTAQLRCGQEFPLTFFTVRRVEGGV